MNGAYFRIRASRSATGLLSITAPCGTDRCARRPLSMRSVRNFRKARRKRRLRWTTSWQTSSGSFQSCYIPEAYNVGAEGSNPKRPHRAIRLRRDAWPVHSRTEIGRAGNLAHFLDLGRSNASDERRGLREMTNGLRGQSPRAFCAFSGLWSCPSRPSPLARKRWSAARLWLAR